jgi:hypothetical protein
MEHRIIKGSRGNSEVLPVLAEIQFGFHVYMLSILKNIYFKVLKNLDENFTYTTL